MATLQSGQTISIQLAEGESYTVTPSGTAQVSTRGVSGSALSAPRTLTSAQTFGPYTEAGAISIACLGGTVDYTQAGGPVYQDPTTGALVGVPAGSPRAVVLGDSLVGNGKTASANTAIYTARAIGQIAAAKTWQRVQIVAEDGIGGATLAGSGATTMNTRVSALLANNAPSWVILIGCSNDIDTDLTAEQIMSSTDGLQAILSKCRSAGAALVFTNTSAGGFGSDARFTQWYELHRRCLELQHDQADFYYLPMFPGAVDYSTTNNARYCVAALGMLYDSRHPSAYGCHAVYSEVLADFFNNAITGAFFGAGVGSRTGLSGAIGDQKALLRNGMFAGTGGSAGSGNSGTVANDFDGSRSGVITSAFSVAARTDRRPGMWQVCTLSGATAATDAVTLFGTGINNAGFLTSAVGKTCWFEIDVEAVASSGTLSQVEAAIQVLDSSSATLFTVAANRIAAGEYMGVTTFKGRLRTPDFVMPANADRALAALKMGTSIGGAAVVKWGAADLQAHD